MQRKLFVGPGLLGLCVVVFATALFAESVWQYARIDAVKKSITSTTKAWLVNTPIEEEKTNYIISVQVQDKIVVGSYELSSTQPEPPVEWTPGVAVKVEIVDNYMYLRSPTGSLRLRITQRKASAPMLPVTLAEKKKLSALEAGPESAQSLIGFSKTSEIKAAAAASTPEPVPAPPPPPPATGTVTVRSTPFLSEVYVDGDSMGYTPAKIALGPGKHSFKVEKPGYRAWTKEMTITVGSDLTLDATLDKK